jgi:hypothetical protein
MEEYVAEGMGAIDTRDVAENSSLYCNQLNIVTTTASKNVYPMCDKGIGSTYVLTVEESIVSGHSP